MDWTSCLFDPNGVKVATLDCIPLVFNNIVTALLIFSGIVAVFLIIVSGIKFMTSGGDPKQVEGAKHTMTYAIIGLIIILLSFFIIKIIAGVTGVNCITIFGLNNCN